MRLLFLFFMQKIQVLYLNSYKITFISDIFLRGLEMQLVRLYFIVDLVF